MKSTVRLSERWSLNVALSYSDAEMEVIEVGSGSTPVEVSFDPLIVNVGATLRL